MSLGSLVGVRFKPAGRIYFFDGSGFEHLESGDVVVAETSRGPDLGRVVIAPGQLVDAPSAERKPLARKATPADLNSRARLKLREAEALDMARSHIRTRDLPMKAVAAEYAFDGSRLTVTFTSAEKRVDFRDLVRDLARALGTRVILHQVGPRDHAKLVGGIDRCGRELCCTTWMPDFTPISIRMAKTQGLPLNPAEISGVCGKLLCCLAFEDQTYSEMRQGLPKLGAKLTSAVGRGRVADVNVLARRITIEWETGARVEVSADEFAEQQSRRERAFGPDGPPLEPPA